MLADYIADMYGSRINYEDRGKRAEAAYLFLDTAEEVSRRGWLRWRKSHAETLVLSPWMAEYIAEFLAARGIGWRKVGERKKKNRTFDDIKKRDIRQTETINAFLLWLQSEREYSPNTLRIYATSLRDYFSYFDEFSQESARRYIAKLEELGMNPKTIRLRITGLERMGEYLKKPIKLKRPKIKKDLSVENVPTEKEYARLLEYLDRHVPKFALIVRVLGSTGCRVSELIQITYEDIQAGTVVLSGKGTKYRRFFFTKALQTLAKGKTGPICMNRYGNVMKTRGISIMLKTYGERAGIDRKKMHPHAFRHFFAKMYLQKTKDVVGLAEILGHGSVETTRIYLQKSYDEQKREIDRVVVW